MKVPKNKKVYVGSRSFKEGETLPTYVLQKHDFNLKSEEDKILDSYDKKKSKSKQGNFSY